MCYSLLRFFQKLSSATPLSNILDPRLLNYNDTVCKEEYGKPDSKIIDKAWFMEARNSFLVSY